MKKLILLLMFAALLPLVNAVDYVDKAVVCEEVVVEGSYTRCIINGELTPAIFGDLSGLAPYTILNVTRVFIGSSPVSSQNVILDIRNSELDFPDTISVFFGGFDSILIENTDIELVGSGLLVNVDRFFNAIDSTINSPGGIYADALSVNLVGTTSFVTDVGPLWLFGSLVTSSPDSSLTSESQIAFIDLPARDMMEPVFGDLVTTLGFLESPRLAQGKFKIKGNVEAPITAILANTSDVTVNNLTATSRVWITGKSVKLGSSNEVAGGGAIGGEDAVVVVNSLSSITQYRHVNITAKKVNMSANEDILISGDMRALLSFFGDDGTILLSGARSFTLSTSGDLVAEDGELSGYAGLDAARTIPSINLSFPSGNVVLKGRLDTYNAPLPLDQPKVNSIEVTAGNVYLQKTNDFLIDSSHIVLIRAPSFYVENDVVADVTAPYIGDIFANRAGAVPAAVNPIKLVTCGSAGLAELDIYYSEIEDFSACPQERIVHVYGYIENAGGQPYNVGSVKVNSVRVAVPNGAYIAGTGPDGNVTATYNAIFSPSNPGFFSFDLPAVSVTAGAYRVNMTFSGGSTFNCETAFCQNREIIATVSPG